MHVAKITVTAHLRHPLRTDETARFNFAQACLPEPVYQFCFDGWRDWPWFVLEAITRANFDDAYKVGLGRVIPTVAPGYNLSQEAGGASLMALGGIFDCAREKHYKD